MDLNHWRQMKRYPLLRVAAWLTVAAWCLPCAGAKEILGAFRNRLAPAAEKHRPDLVLISAGFDSRAGDPLGRFTLSDGDFVELTRMLMEIADKYADGRLISVLEGGYNLAGLASAAAAHVSELRRL